MQWHKYSMIIRPEQEEKACSILLDLGIEGMEIEDGLVPTKEELGRMFVDISPELAPDEMPSAKTAKVHFYLRTEAGEEVPAQTAEGADDSYTIHDRCWSPEEVKSLLEQLRYVWEEEGEGPLRLEEGISREEDWRDEWKQYFKPLPVNDLLILPAWEEVPEEWKEALAEGRMKPLKLELGTAFGSGSHESTRLCLDGLKKWMRGGEKVLDIGCGSGILSLAALLYGADSVTMTELDPACLPVIEENLRLNGLEDKNVRVLEGNVLDELKTAVGSGYQLILCNILAPVICALAAPGAADAFAAPGTLFITSGIYKEHREKTEEAFRANPAWEWVETLPMGDWVSVVVRRKP